MKKQIDSKELKFYGIHACLSIWQHRPSDIVRVYVHSSNLKTFKSVLKWCAEHKKAYHVVSNEELDKISSSVHHEGVCMLAKEKLPTTGISFLKSLTSMQGSACLLYLDGVQNPHNIGSILRTCAHFGVLGILGEKGKLPSLTPAACRIAKGGADIVPLVEIDKPELFFKQLKSKGFEIVSTSSHVKDSLYSTSLPSKMILAIGSEAFGVSKQISTLSSKNIQIPGTGDIESLNVSVATSLCIGEYFRQHPKG